MKIDSGKLMLAMSRACMDSCELCKKAKIGRGTFANIKSGGSNSKPSILGRIAKTLNVDVTEILED